MDRILVIGATGATGRAVISELAEARPAIQIRGLARNPETTRLPANVEVVTGDLTQPETLAPALTGVEAVYLVWTAPFAAFPAALDRIAKSAPRVVFLSSPHKTQHPLFQQPNPLRIMHAEMERLIMASGIEWTFLRPGMFSVNALRWWGPQIRSGAVVRWPYLDVPTAPIHERDIAAIAVRALCDEGHAGKEYLLTGPESLTHADQLRIIGDVLGRTLRVQEMSPEEAPEELANLLTAPVAGLLINAWAAAAGHPAWITGTVAELTGSPARTFREWAVENAGSFRNASYFRNAS